LVLSLLLSLLFFLPSSGTYTYTLVPDSSDDVKAAVNRTVEHMSFFTRPTARRRLARLNPIPQHVQLAITPDTVSVVFDGMSPMVTPVDGSEMYWNCPLTKDGYRIHLAQQGDTLEQVITAPDGERTNALVFDPASGHLAVHVTMTSHRLPQALEYTLVFRRDSTS
jgi:hypothetical protein